MLHWLSEIHGFILRSVEGNIGKIAECYFDDEYWKVRYLVVKIGIWPLSKFVLVSPSAIAQISYNEELMHAGLTREQVRRCPHIDQHQPVSRRMEQRLAQYCRLSANGMYGSDGYTLIPPTTMAAQALGEEDAEYSGRDSHLRSDLAVRGYIVRASGERSGHLIEFFIDDRDWSLPFLAVELEDGNGRKGRAVSTRMVEKVSWEHREIRLGI
jgi:hypothetical protein